jgi:thiol-disulfide isomerase/thioredoxin
VEGEFLNIQFIDRERVDKVIQDDNLVVVWFSVPNCPPCKMIEPFMEEASEIFERVRFYRLDVEKFPDAADNFEVTNVPTLVFFKKGKEIRRLDAITGKKEVFDAIRELY